MNRFRLEDFEYDLPEELIAQAPPQVRHGSRLMHVDRSTRSVADCSFTKIPELLQPGDVLVVNDTKVIPARLNARRRSGAHIEILLLRSESARPGVWMAMASPLKKLREGEELVLTGSGTETDIVKVDALVEGESGQRRVLLDFGSQANVYRILSQLGHAPLPPYIRRDESAFTDESQTSSDLQRYQTIFAQAPGAVAAPTAGLHFSEEIFAALEKRGVQVCKLTLHVGPGTFKPITTSLDDHTIEAERFSIGIDTAAAVNAALDEKRRVIAVGTTSCRALESAGAETGRICVIEDASTKLYIQPGFQFKVIKGLVTNFHLSRSSLLVLVSAFAGHELIMRAYRHAVEERYRFFSYGDAMLIT